MRVEARDHWQKTSLTKAYLTLKPIYPAVPGAELARFHEFISALNFLLHSLLYYAIILAPIQHQNER